MPPLNRRIHFTEMIYGQNKFTPSILFLLGTIINFFLNIRKFNVPDIYTFIFINVMIAAGSYISAL